MTGDDARARMLRLFEGRRLTPAQRRIAHCLVQHAADAPFLSSVEVAELAGVSQPSVTRFATALGFEGYPELRRRLRQVGRHEAGTDGGRPDDARPGDARPGETGPGDLMGAAGTGVGAVGLEDGQPGAVGLGDAQWGAGGLLPGGAGPDKRFGRHAANELQRAVEAEIANLGHLWALLADPAPVAEAARTLAASRPLPVLGLRAAAAEAAAFAYFAAKIHPDVRLLDEGGSLLADRIEQAAAAGAGALLCFALPRHPSELLDALAAARAAGLSVVTVAAGTLTALGELSDVLLTAPVGTRLVFDTACAPMVLGRVLLELMCDALPGAQARLEAFELSAASRGLFIDQPVD
ncbi:MurR/RpiR family transcriptional regulator [Microbispora sp. ATCC PTA-5024]|uniref:MurR/RpiR family transcriptional regulator n=1 Tax=Microbispora sp. ATCC PTA-5024 TaxID=316330 RepID=UPI0003DD028B|nr:MurR/RpiR family transcriptional regulator [Microbispora sp. ATCC PTA-5024]ETK37495.1 transcriptional regulator [Microbispora sp. ATCC PTA-5024]